MTGFLDQQNQFVCDPNPEDITRSPALKVTFKAIALASNVMFKPIVTVDGLATDINKIYKIES